MEFSGRQKADTFNPTIEEVINFLSELYDKGIGYSGIGTARSALSVFISVCSKQSMDIGNNFFVKKFMKGVFNKRPALPKYSSSWDPEIVLNYLKSLHQPLPLIVLSQKLCVLLLLISAQRGQALHLMSISDIEFSDSKAVISFPVLLKQSRPDYHQSGITLKTYTGDKNLCIIRVLREYLERTKDLRGEESRLLITTQPPYKAVARGTISRWVKTIMRKAGIDVSVYKPHSTRAAATSAAKRKGVALSAILDRAGWTRESTFTRFYDKPVLKSSNFQEKILET